MSFKRDERMQSRAKEVDDVSVHSHIVQHKVADYNTGSGSMVFCVILIILVIEMILLLAIVLWRFFDIDIIGGSTGRSNLERFNITDFNDYAHHHYRPEN